jgi:hypothetical protein
MAYGKATKKTKRRSIPKDHTRKIQKPKKLDQTGRFAGVIKRVPKNKTQMTPTKPGKKPKSIPKDHPRRIQKPKKLPGQSSPGQYAGVIKRVPKKRKEKGYRQAKKPNYTMGS